MDRYSDFPILVIDDQINAVTGSGRAIRSIIDELNDLEFSVIESFSSEDGINILKSHAEISCVLIDWRVGNSTQTVKNIIHVLQSVNQDLPTFIMTQRHELGDINLGLLKHITGYIWKMEDTPNFIAGRIETAVKAYLSKMMPPFFKALSDYVADYKYAWHTPGHMGGEAFLKSPAGRIFYDFFGETVFRADLSVSVPELGTLMEHAGVTGEAERFAAKTFGANRTYFVTNGTSTANKMVMCGSVTPGDVVLVDRNCHKSLQHALTMTGAIPVYFIPDRNAYGIIGGIHLKWFDKKAIQKAIAENPLIKDKKVKPKLAVVTNSTYDGLLYDVPAIKEKLAGIADNLHFDEAWYAYAKFHEIYESRFGMCDTHLPHHPNIFATQSTHKLLAAFSQGSMVHVKDGAKPIPHDYFNEAFMMHTSTSPQYSIIASLDVATKMMEGANGHHLIQDAIDEAVMFRKKLVQIKNNIQKSKLPKAQRWFFDIWQPEQIEKTQVKDAVQDSKLWKLKKNATWHGYKGLPNDYMMLDPIKVSILTPGTNVNGSMGEWGIPAPILAKFLMNRGIVDEKTGFYTFLLLFSIGITKAKSGTLLTALLEFKELYDQNAPISEVFPDLVKAFPKVYEKLTIQAFCQSMHLYLKDHNIAKLSMSMFSELPKPVMTPAEAYHELVKGNVEELNLNQLKNRIPAVMLVPYPPGIPIIMPGERFDKNAQDIIDYLKILEIFDNKFSGFETETHGINVREEKGKKIYYVPCIKKS